MGSVRLSHASPFSFKLGDKGAALLVCDGMGGAAAGEVASQMAVDSIFDAMAASEPQDRDGFARLLRRAVQHANERIFIQSRDNQSERGMGTTCTVASLVDETLIIAQIGDSRCYVLRDGKLAQVTKDQSLAWQLIEAGAMTADEAKAFEHANIILQALGVQERVEVVLSQVTLRKGDVALLCSDGLHGPVADEETPGHPDRGAKLTEGGRSPDPEGARPRRARQHHGRAEPFRRRGPEGAGAGRVVTFVGLRPGRRPDPRGGCPRPTPPASRAKRSRSGCRATCSPPTTSRPRRSRTIRSRRPGNRKAKPRSGRSLLALFLLALVAAATGGIFVMKCEHDPSSKVTLP